MAQASLQTWRPPEAPRGPPPEQVFPVRDGRIQHPLVAAGAVEPRAYQTRLAARATAEDLLVVLPTGLGKTVVAALAIAERLRLDPAAQAVVVAPTRPLVLQHADTLRALLALPEDAVACLTGRESPAKRAVRFHEARIVTTTPQGLAHDLDAGRVRLDRTAVLVLDEAHRAVGEYAYVAVAKAFRAQGPGGRLLGLTASPGGDRHRVREVQGHLAPIRVAALDESDPDVAAHVHGAGTRLMHVDLPPRLAAWQAGLQAILEARARKVKGFLPKGTDPRRPSKTAVLQAGDAVRRGLGGQGRKGFLFASILHQGAALEALHCLELLESQGVAPLRDHLLRLGEDAGRGQKAFLREDAVQAMLADLGSTDDLAHPKEPVLARTVRDALRDPSARVLVFAQYRDTVRRLVHVLAAAGVPAERFVGQADRPGDPGLSQDEQKDLLASFSAGATRVLVATSVAEEGLHVPSVDLVVFYEPVVSEIRAIQRRGRTGRTRLGQVVVLATRGTRDDRAYWASRSKERSMRHIVATMESASPAAPSRTQRASAPDKRPRQASTGRPPKPGTLALRDRIRADADDGKTDTLETYAKWLMAKEPGLKAAAARQRVRKALKGLRPPAETSP